MSNWGGPSLLDRAEDRRGDDDWVAGQWAAPGTVVLAVSADGSLGWAGERPDYRQVSGARSGEHLFLGFADGRAIFVEVVAAVESGRKLRAVMDGLAETDLQVVFTAVSLAGWHGHAGFCGSCGAPTVVTRAGLARRCPGCGMEHYPRVDPAVIVAVTDDSDRLLLGRHPSWADGRMSVFAGFVEAGESLEQAVHREVGEEVGLRLADVRYLSSQPWPFPRSIMLGFAARALDTTLTLDTTEIERAAWFTRDELAAAIDAGEVSLPMTTSIAHGMIQHWRRQGVAAAP